MNVNLVLPKAIVHIPRNAHTYYLAGPIRGADDWQAEAINILSELDPGCYVVCPCRYTPDHPLWKYRVVSSRGAKEFSRQTLWERKYMMFAAKYGCLIFWLPCESTVNPRPKSQGPYAQDTYGEIGRYSAIVSAQKDLKLCIGAEKDFPGLDVILVNIDEDFRYKSSGQRLVRHSLHSALVGAKALADAVSV